MPRNRAQVVAWLRARLPFVWVTITPVVTVPLSALLLYTLGGEHTASALELPAGELCRFEGHIAQKCFYYFDFWRTWLLFAIPGAIVNLGVVLWFLKGNGYVHVATVVALLLGLVRSLVIPMAAIAISQFDVFEDGGLWLRVEIVARGVIVDIESPSTNLAIRQLLIAAWAGGAVMWVLTVAVWRAYEPLMARFWRGLEPPGGPRPDQPPRWIGFLGRR